MDDDMEEVLIGSSGYTEQVKIFFLAYAFGAVFKVVSHDLSGVIAQILQA